MSHSEFFYLHSAEDSYLYRRLDECGFGSFSVGIQTPTEIAERHVLWQFICAKAKRQQQMFSVAKAKRQLQLRQGEIDI
ncbi:hypothetical protein [Lysinibacillus pakistanensis]|uniref:Uncharacterized protein n=1 Tax=Lysinibacillus pakistanensis TaxID=759811 RepID=A0AAX3WSE9_9BACI|nr:hypothetical protein [Lysinibacillus pakistanensis]MDM5234574.1 hypothetical protein [Lysinibacillus pakistanensis]WHY45150.1 hypothetical protein QNH22_17780 [Lysinibacillus pakistanensis]WHY50159.1 hypothetical protein QNH24_17745 [Lysinibacillus pakistanensis]